MDTSNVKKVIQTPHIEEVNERLQEGWVLLNTASGQREDTREPYIVYSLGWAQGEIPKAAGYFDII